MLSTLALLNYSQSIGRINVVFQKTIHDASVLYHTPKLLEDAYFRTTERFMNKATAFIKGYSLKKGDDEVHELLRGPRRAGLKTFII